MTTDNAIAVLRRMQEPDPFEPQITQTAFDALEMAIDMIERYSTWSQTYSNMVEDTIYRRDAIDLLKKWADGYKYIETETELAIRDFQHLPSAKLVEDAISRRAAINVLEERLKANGYSSIVLVSELNRSIGYLMQLPSAQPEIIRCKECKHWGSRGLCDIWDQYISNDEFYCGCADAERRTDG